MMAAAGCGGGAPAPQPTPSPVPVATATPVTDADPDPLIAAAGDLVCGRDTEAGTPCKDKETAQLLAAPELQGQALDAVLPLGDLQYEFGQLEDFSRFYDQSWGKYKAISRPALGNHEYGDKAFPPDGYFDYFNGRGAVTGPAGPRGLGYYSFDIGAWHLIALNSNCANVPGGCTAGSAQEKWLRADLVQHPSVCTLAYWHHPRFSSGPNGNTAAMQPLWQTLYDFGADVILVAHDHMYERFAPQTAAGSLDERLGQREFVVGTGGRSLYDFKTPQPNSVVRYKDNFGVLFLKLHPTSYTWKFESVDRKFNDGDTAFCH
jgi:hypothetical protein